MKCLARRRTVCLLRRTFVTTAGARAKTVTKRKYEDLPTVHILPDGSEARPLPQIQTLYHTRRRIRVKNVQNEDEPADSDLQDDVVRSVSTSHLRAEGISSGAPVLDADLDQGSSGGVDKSLENTTLESAVPKRRPRRKRTAIQDVSTDASDSAEQAAAETAETGSLLDPVQEKEMEESVTATSTPEELPKRRKRRTRALAETPKEEEETPTFPDVDEAIPYTRLAREIQQNMQRFPHCILLTRVGQFYESYFDQAPILASLLDIKLTSRAWGRQGSRVHMCGFPLQHLDRHLKTLVQQHKRFVAMCEEFPRPPGAEPGFDRRVTRVVTPGTLIDESFLNQYENNYLLAIGRNPEAADVDSLEGRHRDGEYGLAWIDVSTGEFFTQPTSIATLRNDIARIAPKEVVLHESMRGASGQVVRDMIGEELGWISYASPEALARDEATPDIVNQPSISDTPTTPADSTTREPVDGEALRTESDDVPADNQLSAQTTDDAFTPSESMAIDLLTAFLRTNLLELMPRLSAPIREAHEERMLIDSHTIKALEIREGMAEGGTTGSLLSVVKRTITTSGTRLLARWLCSPSTSLGQIKARQSLVTLFHARQHLRSDLQEFLYQIEDASRIVQKFLLGKGDANDLLAIRDTINVTAQIKTRILQERELELQADPRRAEEWHYADILLDRMRDLSALAQRIDDAVDESEFRRQERAALGAPRDEDDEAGGLANVPIRNPAVKSDAIVWTMKPNFSPELRRLHDHLASLHARKEQLEQELKEEYSAPSLQLKTSLNFGLHLRLGNPKRDSKKIHELKSAILIGQSASSKTFLYPPWTKLGGEISNTEQAILQAERKAFEALRSEVNSHSTSLRRNARIVDEVDVTIGFANAAHELRLVKPEMDDGLTYHVHNGRHPTVELGLLDAGRIFTPNSVTLSPTSRLHIITGPNMAGKSTLLRQTALIAILAQTGSYVPADRAHIGIVDKVFSRVGAKDDLFRDRSTFMVEMLETAEILRSATWRSLVIMDEVGRGTTVVDGLAIAFATVNHLYHVNKCRSLFATHFHELVDMLGYTTTTSLAQGEEPKSAFPHIGFFCTDVDEIEDERFAYSYRLRPGVNRDSHGLKVARLAGMPEGAMHVAALALKELRGRKGAEDAGRLKALGEELGRMQLMESGALELGAV